MFQMRNILLTRLALRAQTPPRRCSVAVWRVTIYRIKCPYANVKETKNWS